MPNVPGGRSHWRHGAVESIPPDTESRTSVARTAHRQSVCSSGHLGQADSRERWLRPRLRLDPAKSRIGFRAAAPNEAWHVDVTINQLLDGTKAYLHAIIDNYSRRILAWTVAERLNPMNTCLVLNQAAASLSEPETKVHMDSGVENLTHDVDKLLEGGTIERTIVQIDVSFSNSLIECWWRYLKR